MKFFKIIISILFWQNLCHSQMNITTDQRNDYIWNQSKNDWILISSNDSEYTFFKFNKELTLFKHTTANLTSAYIINSSERDEKRDQFTFEVTSDVGNNYLMIIDINNNNVRFIGENEDGMFLVRHNIKRLWTED